MHPDLEDPPVYEGPFLSAMKSIGELALALYVYRTALPAAVKQVAEVEKRNKKARKFRREHPEFSEPDGWVEYDSEDEALARAKQRADFARAQLNADSPYLYSLGTIRLWGILEAAVDDGVAAVIQTRPKARKGDGLAKIRVPYRELADADPSEQAQIVVRALKDETGATKKPGVDRFESLLDTIGLGGPYHPEVKKVVVELAATRHVLVHRDGVADERFLRQCSWATVKKGDRLAVSQVTFRRFEHAAEWLILEYYRRLRVLDGESVDKGRLQTQVFLTGHLLGKLSSRLDWPPTKLQGSPKDPVPARSRT